MGSLRRLAAAASKPVSCTITRPAGPLCNRPERQLTLRSGRGRNPFFSTLHSPFDDSTYARSRVDRFPHASRVRDGPAPALQRLARIRRLVLGGIGVRGPLRPAAIARAAARSSPLPAGRLGKKPLGICEAADLGSSARRSGPDRTADGSSSAHTRRVDVSDAAGRPPLREHDRLPGSAASEARLETTPLPRFARGEVYLHGRFTRLWNFNCPRGSIADLRETMGRSMYARRDRPIIGRSPERARYVDQDIGCCAGPPALLMGPGGGPRRTLRLESEPVGPASPIPTVPSRGTNARTRGGRNPQGDPSRAARARPPVLGHSPESSKVLDFMPEPQEARRILQVVPCHARRASEPGIRPGTDECESTACASSEQPRPALACEARRKRHAFERVHSSWIGRSSAGGLDAGEPSRPAKPYGDAFRPSLVGAYCPTTPRFRRPRPSLR